MYVYTLQLTEAPLNRLLEKVSDNTCLDTIMCYVSGQSRCSENNK